MLTADPRWLKVLTTVIIVVLPTIALGAQNGETSTDRPYLVSTGIPLCEAEDKRGELDIYQYMTQIGTVARRECRNESGLIYKTILYRERMASHGALSGTGSSGAGELSLRPPGQPVDESEITPYEVVIHRYGKDNRLLADCHYVPPCKDSTQPNRLTLSRVLVMTYDAQGNIASRTWLRADGTRQYEILYKNKREVSHVYYDKSGLHVVGFRGQIPSGHDLSTGWGESRDGLSCGIGTEYATATLESACVDATIKNESDYVLPKFIDISAFL